MVSFRSSCLRLAPNTIKNGSAADRSTWLKVITQAFSWLNSPPKRSWLRNLRDKFPPLASILADRFTYDAMTLSDLVDGCSTNQSEDRVFVIEAIGL